MNRNSVIKALMAFVIIFPGLALGAVHPVVLAVFLIPSAVLLAYLSLLDRKSEGLTGDIPSIILLILIGFTAFQLIPLPAQIVAIISPVAHGLRAEALSPLNLEAPSFMPLTLDVTLTIAELGKLCLYLSVYWAAKFWTRRNGSEFVLTLVVVAGALSAFVLLAHKVLMLENIYGFYNPIHLGPRGDRVTAPLINENHMAAFLGLGCAVAIGMAVAARDRSKRILGVLVAALIGGSILLTLSRGGIVAFVVGQLVFVLLRVVERIRHSKGKRESGQMGWILLGLVLSMGLGLFAAQDAIIGEFVNGDHKKIELLGQGLPLIGKFPFTGVGRGAFWVSFPLVSDWAATTTFTHAENAVVQLLVDYGVLFGALALLGFGGLIAGFLLHPPRRARDAAALAAVVAFAVHNLIDFNMEVPGVAVLVSALMGVLVASKKESSIDRRLSSLKFRGSIIRAISVLTLILAGLTAFYSSTYNIDSEERRLRAELGRGGSVLFNDESIEAIISRHPTDWYLPFLVGAHKFHTANVNALPWLGRALDLNRHSASAHFYVGRVFLRAGHLSQAMVEFRLASRKRAGLAGHIARYLIEREPRFSKLKKIAIDDADKRLLWSALAHELSRRGISKEARLADQALIALKPPDPGSLARHARRLVGDGEIEQALKLASQLEKLANFSISGSMLRAEILIKDKRLEEGLAVLESALAENGDDRQLLYQLTWARQRAGDHDGAMEMAGRIKDLATNIHSRASAVSFQGDIERADGRIQSALARYRQAHGLDPSNLAILKKIANLAEKHGDKARTLDALRKMKNLDPSNKDWKSRIKEIENRARLAPER